MWRILHFPPVLYGPQELPIPGVELAVLKFNLTCTSSWENFGDGASQIPTSSLWVLNQDVGANSWFWQRLCSFVAVQLVFLLFLMTLEQSVNLVDRIVCAWEDWKQSLLTPTEKHLGWRIANPPVACFSTPSGVGGNLAQIFRHTCAAISSQF